MDLLSTMPQEAREIIEPIMQEMEPHIHHLTGLTRIIDVSAPDTTFARMDRYIHALVARIDTVPREEFEGFMVRLVTAFVRALSHPAVSGWFDARLGEMAANQEREACGTRNAKLLLQLAGAANAKVPYAAGIIALEAFMGGRLGEPSPKELADFGQTRALRATMLAASPLNEVSALRGEARCRALLEAAGAPMERLYTSYLRLLDGLLQVLLDRAPLSPKLTFGQLVRQVHHDLPAHLQGLVDPGVTTRRNASCHGNWRYLPGKGSVEFWDANKPHETMVLAAFERRTLRAFQTAVNALTQAASAIFMRDLLWRSGMLSAQVSSLRLGPNGEFEANEEAMREWGMRTLVPYMAWRMKFDA